MKLRTVVITTFLMLVSAVAGGAASGLNHADADATPVECAADASRTFYVAPNGSDTNNGTADAPWQSLQYALDHVNAGETLLVREGVYRGDFTYARAGTSDAPITVRNYPGESPILEPATREPLRVRDGAAWTVFQGLTFQKAAEGSNYQNVYVLGDAHDVTFKHNTIRWAKAGSGVFVDNTTRRIDFIGNRVYENNEPGVQHQGIYYEGQDGVIARNLVYGQTNGFGIQVKTGASGVTVAQNTTVDNSLSGILVMDSATNVTVANNVSAFNGGWGIRGLGVLMTEPAGRAFSNLLYGNKSGSYANSSPGIIDFDSQLPAADPLFRDPSSNDYHVLSGSPAIDATEGGIVYSPDADGQSSVLGARPDVGAFEAG